MQTPTRPRLERQRPHWVKSPISLTLKSSVAPICFPRALHVRSSSPCTESTHEMRPRSPHIHVQRNCERVCSHFHTWSLPWSCICMLAPPLSTRQPGRSTHPAHTQTHPAARQTASMHRKSARKCPSGSPRRHSVDHAITRPDAPRGDHSPAASPASLALPSPHPTPERHRTHSPSRCPMANLHGSHSATGTRSRAPNTAKLHVGNRQRAATAT
jgi:hypothetical protein